MKFISTFLISLLFATMAMAGPSGGNAPTNSAKETGGNLASILSAINTNALTQPLATTGVGSADASVVSLGATSTTLNSGNIPLNGYQICNSSASIDVWVTDLKATAAVNGAGSFRVPANGGCYTTPAGAKPVLAIQAISASSTTPITLRTW